MLSDYLAISVTDALCFHQRKEHNHTLARQFSAISLRLKTPGKYVSRGKTYPFQPGCVCILPEGIDYDRYTEEEDILVIHFRFLNYVMDEIRVFPVTDTEVYERLFRKALALKEENAPGCGYRITAIVYELLALLTEDGRFGQPHEDKRILESADFMRQNLSDPTLSIESLAQRACVSPAYYRRQFRLLYGTSPKSYLDTLRIRYAGSLLETGYFSQTEVAQRCGYTDVAYFRTAFKRKTGKSIREYLSNKSSGNC